MTGQLRISAPSGAVRRPVELVPLSALQDADSPRLSGADLAHAQLLAESDVELPPILVNHTTMRVIDGTHRVLAAGLRGRSEIEVQFFDCDDEEAFVLAVEANVAHGLPLPLADRTAAARRIIAGHPHWSDRAVASVTGLAHKTVGSIRRRSTGETPHSNTRRGRDGRMRPVDRTQGRVEAVRLLAERPDASLREIARQAGISATTVRDVRARIGRGEDPVLPRQREPGQRPGGAAPAPQETPGATGRRPEPTGRLSAVDCSALVQNLRKDPSLRFSESGRLLLRLLDGATTGPQEWSRIRDNVPTHCVDTVATVARACAQAFCDFAEEVEQRRAHQSSG